MKKIIAAITSALAAVILAVVFAACGTNYVGTYKLGSVKMESTGMTVEYVAGQTNNGITITEDACVLEVNDDNTWSITMNLMGASNDAEGTWSINDDGNLVLTEDATGDEIVATLDGSTLVFSETQSGMTMTLTLNKK